MITLTQLRQADEIRSLTEYYSLCISAAGPVFDIHAVTSVSVLKISDNQVIREAYLPASKKEADLSDSNFYSLESIASGLLKLARDGVVAAEPETLQILRLLLEHAGYEGEVRFLPVCRLAAAVFPAVRGGGTFDVARILAFPEPDVSEELREVYLEANILENCRRVLCGEAVSDARGELFITPPPKNTATSGSLSPEKGARAVSDETLKKVAKSVWTASPWVFAVLAIVLVILAVILIPHTKDTTVNRDEPPVSYLVLSWDETGKYGTQLKSRGNEENPIQFRIPYGVYNVLNNNSIPVELHIISESDEDAASSNGSASATALSSSDEEEEEDSSNSRVILRPNSTRQITIDTEQYLTLSEDATDLIFFYVSEVPEEPETDTTGQVYAGNVVVYAYVKGTEVRFRRAPSLEGQIIDTLNNGQQVQVLAISGEWTHVQVQDQKGYIFSQYLDTTDPNERNIAPEASAAPEEDASAEEQEGTDPAVESGDADPAKSEAENEGGNPEDAASDATNTP